MSNDDFKPIKLSKSLEAAGNVSVKVLKAEKNLPHLSPEDLQRFVSALFGGPAEMETYNGETYEKPDGRAMAEAADYHAIMNAIADEQELGNNADPIQPEDCDTNIIED